MDSCYGVSQGIIIEPKLSNIIKFITKDIMSLSVTICNELMKLEKWFSD